MYYIAVYLLIDDVPMLQSATMGNNDHVQPATLFLLLVLTHVAHPVGAQHLTTCPKMCLCHVTQVFCDNQNLDFVPKFQRKVTVIYLRNNAIKMLRMTWFDHMPWLEHLLLKNNHISRIEQGTFLNLTSLISLSLTDNKLRRLATETFYGMRRLRVISLRNNQLTRIDDIFIDLTNIQLINVANNRIRRIGRHAFMSNKRLSVLDVRNNSITTIHRRTFRYLPLLKFLVLRDNPIKTIMFDFRPNYHMELIDFTNCSLKRIARGLPYSVKDLRMSENNITHIDRKDFRKTRQIQVLDLNHNRIGRIHRKSFVGLRVLKNLYIGKNIIKRIPRNLPVSMQGLYANFNNINRVPPWLFPRGIQLENLYLNNNKIEMVHHRAFDELHNLRSLDLNTNSIRLLKQYTFCNLSNLDLLDLSNNPIMKIEDDSFVGLDKLRIFQLASISHDDHFARLSLFKGMRNLRFLDMHNTPALTGHMEQDAFYGDYLDLVENLNLMNNKLRSLPSDFPKHFPSLQSIKLSGNPWHCDKSIYWLVKWVRSSSVSLFAPEHMTCETPPSLHGRSVIYLHESELKGGSATTKHGHTSHGQMNQPQSSISDNYGPVRIPIRYEERYIFTITKQTVNNNTPLVGPVGNSNASENRPSSSGPQKDSSKVYTEVASAGKTQLPVNPGQKKNSGQKQLGFSVDNSETQLNNTIMENTHLKGHQNLTDVSQVPHNGRQKLKEIPQKLPNGQTQPESSQHMTTHLQQKPSLHRTTETLETPEQSHITPKPHEKQKRYLSSIPIPENSKLWHITTRYSDKTKGKTKLDKDTENRARSPDKHKFDNDID